MKINKVIIVIMTSIILPAAGIAQAQLKKIKWTVAAKLLAVRSSEQQLGLAGVFAGVSGNKLLVAGGSYFPGKKPWEGGRKAYTGKISVLERNKHGEFSWLSQEANLKEPVAYGASVTIADGVICAGGENEAANCSDHVFLMQWDGNSGTVLCRDLPSLPVPLSNSCMAAIGKQIYLIGGESKGKPSNKAFLLDLSNKDGNWEPLPEMPLAMSHSVAVAQFDGTHQCIYVIGGRSSTASGITELHNRAYRYDPLGKTWTTLPDISDGNHKTNLSAAAGVPFEKNQIVIVSGDKGNIFHQIERYNEEIAKADNEQTKLRLQQEKLKIVTNHPGFSRDVLVYNTLTNQWKQAGELPFLGHVTTPALMWNNEIFIPAGEIKPGTRTPDILRGQISHDFE